MASDESKRTVLDFLRSDYDRVIIGNPSDAQTTAAPVTGWDRLKRMFSLDQYGEQSKEVVMMTQTLYASTMGGAIIGAIVQSRNAFINFLENNQATKFHNQLDAKRELQRVMFVAFGKGAFKWGWRVGMFSLTFTTLMTTVSVYRGKESLVEYIVAGGVTGALYKMNLGLKGAFSGCLAGTFLGGIAGGASLLVLRLGGVTMDELREFSKSLKDSREVAIRQKLSGEAKFKDVNLMSNKLEDIPSFEDFDAGNGEEEK